MVRILLAALAAFLIVLGAWALIEYRSQPPLPPEREHPLGTPRARPQRN